jgi:hypothetical protein
MADLKNHEKECFACQDAEGNLVGIDHTSGGYPWVPYSIFGVRFWTTVEPALKYAGIWQEGKTYTKGTLTPVRVRVIIEPLEELKKEK